LTVDVDAPAGTKVKASSSGAFTTTEVSRRVRNQEPGQGAGVAEHGTAL
jgi:hypothetical protein